MQKAPVAVHHRSACSGVKALRNTSAAKRQAAKPWLAFRSLDPFRALREPDRRRRDEERPFRSEQRTGNKPKRLLDRKSPIQVVQTIGSQRGAHVLAPALDLAQNAQRPPIRRTAQGAKALPESPATLAGSQRSGRGSRDANAVDRTRGSSHRKKLNALSQFIGGGPPSMLKYSPGIVQRPTCGHQRLCHL